MQGYFMAHACTYGMILHQVNYKSFYHKLNKYYTCSSWTCCGSLEQSFGDDNRAHLESSLRAQWSHYKLPGHLQSQQQPLSHHQHHRFQHYLIYHNITNSRYSSLKYLSQCLHQCWPRSGCLSGRCNPIRKFL